MAAIIFDFDGTIADSFDYVAGFLERHVRRGRPLTPDEKQALRGMTMKQMALHLGSPRWRLPLLFIRGRFAMGRIIYQVPLFEGMGKVIEQLQAEGHELMIVSSNNGRNIRKFLRQHHLYKYITDIYPGAGFFGKERALRRIMRRNRISPGQTIYLGDEVRDVVEGRAAGVRVVAVSWGFDQPDLLRAHQPVAFADRPEDIVRILEEL